MTDETRAELRATIESLVRLSAISLATRPDGVGGSTVAFLASSGCRLAGFHKTPALTTVQQLALSVLVGEPDRVVLSALCDCLIEQGHEYAVEVAEKARREKRERCRELVVRQLGRSPNLESTT